MFGAEAHTLQQLIHPPPYSLLIVDQTVGVDRLGNRKTDRLARIERGEGILEDILHFLAHAEALCR